MSWEADLEEARRRLAALDVERELASAREARASSRWVAPFSEFFLPLPPVARPKLSLYGDWREETEDDWTAERVDFDAAGRPVAHIMGAGSFMERTNLLWRWDDDGAFWEIEAMGFGPHVRRFTREYVVSASADGTTLVQHLTWRDGRAVRSEHADGTVREAEYAADGTLERIVAGDDLVWDGRIERPEPWPADPFVLVEPLAVALDGALRAAIADGPVETPYVIQVLNPRDGAFPPCARIVGARWRDGTRRSSTNDTAAIDDLYKAIDAGQGMEVELVDRLDADALRACRALSTALHVGARDTREPSAVVAALAERLAQLLHATPVAGAAEPFLALVELGDDMPGHERARRTAPHYERFMASIASTQRRGEGVPVGRALRDRDALEAYLSAGGLGEGAEEATGLDAFAALTYEELVEPLWEPFRDLGHHWLGGHVTGAQFIVDDTGTRLLLHVESDEQLGFHFLDAGTLQFRLPPDALAERDWSRVVTVADSC